MEGTSYVKLKISLQHSHSPVYDLSGTNPFDVFFEVDMFRGDGGGWRSTTLLLNGSMLDVPHASSLGLLELIDLDADRKIVFDPKSDGTAGSTPSTLCSDSFDLVDIEENSRITFTSEDDSLTTSAPSAQPQNRFVTLPTRESGGRRKAQKAIPLCIPKTIKHMLKSGRKYRLQITSIDLGVKWWRYGSQEELAVKDVPIELLSPSEPGAVVATQLCHRDFTVFESLPVPPSVHISLDLSHPFIYRSGDPAPTLKISVTNTADQPVTMNIFWISTPHIYSRPTE